MSICHYATLVEYRFIHMCLETLLTTEKCEENQRVADIVSV